MTIYAMPQNSFAASCKSEVVCPKPRRLVPLHAAVNDPSPLRPFRFYASHYHEIFDSRAGNELCETILPKGGFDSDQQVASSPPFFSGSPPMRVANPQIQDARFGAEKSNSSPVSAWAVPNPNRSARSNFGSNPAVIIEGFDCVDRKIRVAALA